MAEDEAGPLARELRRRMDAAEIGQKRLALQAGVNETYVRDILKGRSKNPEASKLSKIAAALGCTAADLLSTAATDAGQFVSDPRELFLIDAWRELSEPDRMEVAKFIRFRLSLVERDEPTPLREQV